MLKSNIEKLGIQFIDAHYEARAYNSVEDEKRIYDKIVNKYKETNCAFNEAAQHYTIERDACSIAKTYLLRDSRTPMNLADAGYIFVTANQTLAMAASEYHLSLIHILWASMRRCAPCARVVRARPARACISP